MAYTQDDLAMARRHVAEGEERVLRQRQLVGRLEERGEPTGAGLDLLEEFEATLEQMRVHLAVMEEEIGA